MRIRLSIPDHLVTPAALEAALEATALANEQAILRGEVPPLSDAIDRGVRWKPEPFLDGEHFDLAGVVSRRGWGDCDDLAPWLAGELRATGDDPEARPRVYKTGKDRWHVVVQTGDGQILDPSKWAGMGRKSSATAQGVSGQIARPFARPDGGALCVVPHEGKWWARCDVPWPDGSGHLASHARARSPDAALDRAVNGALCCGEMIESPLCDRARAAGSILLNGADDIGSVFKGLMKAARPFASMVPGGSLAHSAVSKLTKGGGGKHPKDSVTHPNGSVSVPVERMAPAAQDRLSRPQGERPQADHGQHMMLYYHPAFAPGPVIMRF